MAIRCTRRTGTAQRFKRRAGQRTCRSGHVTASGQSISGSRARRDRSRGPTCSRCMQRR
jgi:hypothetical protein